MVLVLADDQGGGETGYTGHPHLNPPVLADMAAAGLRLDPFDGATRVFAPNHSTPPEKITIAHVARDAGYRTGHFGKWHVRDVKAASPTDPARVGSQEYLAHDSLFEVDPPLSRTGDAPQVIPGESSQICVDAALAFLKAVLAEGDSPFSTTLWFGSPHSPIRSQSRDTAS